MAGKPWPCLADIADIVKNRNYKSGNDAFNTFKKKAIAKGSETELQALALHAPVVWDFLVGFAAVKAMYRKHIIQVFHKLMEIPEWVDAWEAQSALHVRMKELHEDLQAALALQSTVLQKSISPEAFKSMAGVKLEERPEHVRVDIAKDRLVDQIAEDSLAASDPLSETSETNSQPPAEQAARGAAEPSNPEAEFAALHEGISEAIAIKSEKAMDVDGKRALQKLRVGCIRCAGREDIFQQDAGLSHEVFHFLFSYVRRRPSEVSHVAEVVNQLMASPSWAIGLGASDVLKEELRSLPLRTQAYLGLQHKQLLQCTISDAQTQAKSGDLKDAVEVAEVMKSIRFTPTETEASKTTSDTSEPPPPPPAKDEWKEARTAEGHCYYFNVRTRQSVWERPDCLGGPMVYKVGEEVEIWSNSQKVWGRGTVKAVNNGLVTAEFSLPNGQTAQKELPAKHRDLRHLERARWTELESTQYREWFLSLPRVDGDADVRTGVGVAEFLRGSNIPREALMQVWAVGNPDGKEHLNFESFARCCRLVAHCQHLLTVGQEEVYLVNEGGRPLRVKLRGDCLPAKPPQGLPKIEFSNSASAGEFSNSASAGEFSNSASAGGYTNDA
eukprot:TRINITY_DN6801_c0_g1_i1.p1 TRINITY_DN6801_c0_g1~~TRINITY_DN6801_c0_g1_i1.p1  ORF type:complete len:655 (+),score=82.88 TRINITY_DN6801_c0_g1_i1:127-1965(+)